jgi:hypothetical protein
MEYLGMPAASYAPSGIISMRFFSHDSAKKKARDVNRRPFLKLARPEGFEPPTPWFVAKYSIQMSYGRVERREL